MIIPLFTQVINPSNVEYKTFVINSQTALLFDSTLGVYATNYIEENTIITDESLMPW